MTVGADRYRIVRDNNKFFHFFHFFVFLLDKAIFMRYYRGTFVKIYNFLANQLKG